MKGIMMILSSLVVAGTLLAAPPTQRGTYEVRIEPVADLGDVEGNVGVPIRGAFGYYLSQNLQCGLSALLAKKDFESYWGKANVWGLGLYAELSPDWDWPLFPYVGLAGSLLDDSNDNRDMVLVMTVSPGLKVFLSDWVSLSVQANWNSAAEDIYRFERRVVFPSDLTVVRGSGESSSITGAMAIRFLF